MCQIAPHKRASQGTIHESLAYTELEKRMGELSGRRRGTIEEILQNTKRGPIRINNGTVMFPNKGWGFKPLAKASRVVCQRPLTLVGPRIPETRLWLTTITALKSESAITLWNELPFDIKASTSSFSFRKHVKHRHITTFDLAGAP